MAYEFLKRLFLAKSSSDFSPVIKSEVTNKFSWAELEELITRSATSFEIEEILASLSSADLTGLASTLRNHEALRRLLQTASNHPRSRAFQVFQCLNTEAIQFICDLALDENNPVALLLCNNEEIYKSGYNPITPTRLALFYFLTNQTQAYETFDPDVTLLQQVFENSTSATRRRILTQARKIGRHDIVILLGGKSTPATIDGEIRPDRLSYGLIEALENKQDWEKLWQLVQKTSAHWSLQILRKLATKNWQPSASADQKTYRNLLNLALDCPSALRFSLANHKLTGQAIAPGEISLGKSQAFSPDGRNLVVLTPNHQLKIWSLPDRILTKVISAYALNVAPEDYSALETAIKQEVVPELQLDPNLFSGSYSITPILNVPLRGLAVSYDSNLIICSGKLSIRVEGSNNSWQGSLEGHAVWLHRVNSPEHIKVFLVDSVENTPDKFIFSQDSQFVVMVCGNSLELRQTNTLQLDKKLKFSSSITELILATTGQLVVGFSDGLVRFLDLPQLTVSYELNIGQPVISLALSPNGQLLACGQELLLYDLENAKRLTRPEVSSVSAKKANSNYNPIQKLIFSPDGQLLLAIHQGGLVRLLTPTGEFLDSFKYNSPDSTLIFAANGQYIYGFQGNSQLQVWASSLTYLYNLPITQARLEHLKLLTNLLEGLDAAAPERSLVEFINAQLYLKWRYEIEIDGLTEVTATEYDIELGYD